MYTLTSWHRVGLMTLLVCGSLVATPALTRGAARPPKPAEPPVKYRLTTLPQLDGSTDCVALGMNNVGDVVGLAGWPDGTQRGWLYRLYTPELGETVSLNDPVNFPLPTGWLPGSFIQHASDINDDGDIAATASKVMPGGPSDSIPNQYRALRYTPERGFEELDVPPGYAHCYANAINKWGDVVGQAQKGEDFSATCAVLWPAGGTAAMVLTGVGISTWQAHDINDVGQIVGDMTVSGTRHAFRLTPAFGIKDLGVLPRNTTSYAYSINNSGQVAGQSQGGKGGQNAFRYTDGVGMINLGALPNSVSWPYAIDDAGHVVGKAIGTRVGTEDAPDRVFLYTDQTGIIDLVSTIVSAPPGVDLGSLEVREMNTYVVSGNTYSFGQICGDVINIDGERVPCVLTPDR